MEDIRQQRRAEQPDDAASPSGNMGAGQGGGPATARDPASEPARDRFPPVSPPAPPPAVTRRSGALRRFVVSIGKRLATLVIAVIAITIAIVTWQEYVLAPWTRDGSIRVQVANVAPQVAGQIIEVNVADNQFVKQGDVLYTIEPLDYQVAVSTSQAQLAQAAADFQLKKVESQRRQKLTDLATTAEEQQIFAASAAEAKAVFDAAQQQLTKAQLNLNRTKVLSPVNGYVTNLLLRVGDYAQVGASNISVIDADSFWIDGYFEETKMAGICIGDRVEAMLMGYSTPIVGRVETVTRGISVENAGAGAQGLPSVDPIYTWVRLAQRIPVRIAIEKVPEGVPLVSGMTATVTVRSEQEATERPNWIDRAYETVRTSFSSLVYGPPSPREGCLPVMTTLPVPTEALPAAKETPGQSAEELAPGIAPGLNVSPRRAD